MFSLCVLVLTLLVSAVQASSSSGGTGNYHYDLSGQALTDLYNSPVYEAELMYRPFSSSSSAVGPGSHSGVRVTLRDPERSQWLIHKGMDYGIDSDTVVVSAGLMSSRWKTLYTKNFHGTRTVADFVRTGGSSYSTLTQNCHIASVRMMLQNFSFRDLFPFCFFFCN
uniref:Uncharacterized protein n=1 Tax=Sphaeramia orbicularis TaxID=375764 RepID=A0A673A209_9TELE